MAKNQTVWGIDIGNTSLKALRCTLAEESGKVEALACDFIEHSKVLSQPGTDVAEVMAETLQTFLSRNVTKGDRIAISVSGQNTISRFLPLPPVDPKKIPDVIRYEAKQWLPFALEDVVFDFQPLTNPSQENEEGFSDATVGMFAIKRDVASKAIAPYLSRSVDIDSIQSSPIALYNFMAFDLLPPPAAEPSNDDDAPRESLIVLCIGTDATDVVITNGETIWIRNIPLGGNSFTKALTRELQLTFSKAEYLKRNITTSKDVEEQKRVITAMRPVFNDMVNEVNRSLEYYQTLNRKAKFQKIVALGNAAKLPGLRQFIAQNLGYEVVRLNQFNKLVGSEVVATQLFKDNLHSFAVCYGLAVQQLGLSSLKTNLIPREVIVDRIIREKKPWMLVAAAALLLGITIQIFGVSSAHSLVVNDAYKRADDRAKSTQSFSSDLKSKTSSAVSELKSMDEKGQNLTSNVEGRIVWLELLRAINAVLPQSQPGVNLRPTTADDFANMDAVFIESIEACTVDSLAEWFGPLKENNRYYPDDDECIAASGGDDAATTSDTTTNETPPAEGESENGGEAVATSTAPPAPRKFTEAEKFALVAEGKIAPAEPADASKPPKIVQLVGRHYCNPNDPNDFAKNGGEAYLRNTLLKNLKSAEIDLPPTFEEQQKGIKSKKVTMGELGISFPVLLYVPNPVTEIIINPSLMPLPPDVVIDPVYQSQLGGARGGGLSDSGRRPGAGSGPVGSQRQLSQYAQSRGVAPKDIILAVRRFDFVIQFAWVETPPSKRIQEGEENPEGAATENAE
jgi:type IV pilus assembly protein PilM